jgi:hypothetical protein
MRWLLEASHIHQNTARPRLSEMADLFPLPVKCLHGRNQTNPAYRAGKSCGLSEQAESGGAGHGAWEISPATRSECPGWL